VNLRGRPAKKRGGKNEGIFHYVVENTCIKNVRNEPFHYVDEKKGGYSLLSIMLMKRNGLIEKAWRGSCLQVITAQTIALQIERNNIRTLRGANEASRNESRSMLRAAPQAKERWVR